MNDTVRRMHFCFLALAVTAIMISASNGSLHKLLSSGARADSTQVAAISVAPAPKDIESKQIEAAARLTLAAAMTGPDMGTDSLISQAAQIRVPDDLLHTEPK